MKAARKRILWSIPVLVIIGTVMHFVYGWSGKTYAVGLIAPMNESIWEHLKLTFWPMVVWWFLWFGLRRGDDKLPADGWVTPAVAAILTCPLVVVSFHYAYTGAFGIESLALDILSMVLGIALGQLLGLHLLERGRFGRWSTVISLVILVVMAGAFTAFTVWPPHLPLFKDDPTGTYGIRHSKA